MRAGATVAPRAVLVRDGRALVDYGHRVAIFDGVLSWHDRGLLMERWEGRLDFHGPVEARLLAHRVVGENVHAAYQFHHTLSSKDELVVEMFRIEPPEDGSPSGWTEYLGDIGVAAIADDGRTWAVVSERVVSFDAPGQPAAQPADRERSDLGRGTIVAESRAAEASAYEGSLTGAGWIVVGITSDESRSSERVLADLERKRGHLTQGKWSSWVSCYDGEATECWRLAVPYAIRQPPVDGGEGRVLLCGDRVACVNGGALLWEYDPQTQCRGTADADGALVLSVGNGVRILDAAGTSRGQIEVAEPIRTPPAIDARGDIWVATSNALYRGE
jgi:hypothetical protein